MAPAGWILGRATAVQRPSYAYTRACRRWVSIAATDIRYMQGALPDCHQVGQGGPVNRKEGFHLVLRSILNRLVRRTKGYTKSIAAPVYSMALACRQLGQNPLSLHAKKTARHAYGVTSKATSATLRPLLYT